ncbi:MAG: hypothetical protein IPP31_09975 [Chitinophagaceae bacterium]|nr:hypothetical protein [Chitinophagaceae bacterium]
MSSQRAGFSEGTTSQKLKRYRILDALVTFYDNRIRIPVKCKRYRMKADQEALFLINLAPVVFTDSFQPDVDAVYLTYKKEIAGFLANRFAETINGSGIRKYEEKKKLIFLEMEKRIKGS